MELSNNIPTQKDFKVNQSELKEMNNLKFELNENSKINEEQAQNIVRPIRTSIKRNNSIKLYKKQQNERHKKDVNYKEEVKNNDFYKASSNKNLTLKNVNKKVVFLPNFLTIIDVESYKKFNEENTCKDPFYNIELLNHPINIDNKEDGDEYDGKVRVQCSCFIF